MAIKTKTLRNNVLVEAMDRVVRVFDTGLPVYLSISGGKDSICLTSVIYNLILEGKINPKKLTVLFIDEEAMFEDVIQIVFDWRIKLMKKGVTFHYFCVESKHHNCLNALENDLSFITWDRYKKDVWVRQMPEFAITSHPLLKDRVDSYQDFLTRVVKNGISLVGLRAAESVQRKKALASTITSDFKNKKMGRKMLNNYIYPIYDWQDSDVWKYIDEQNLDFPKTYLNLYQIGLGKRDMRISQFFSIDTAKVLARLGEYDPTLMKRVEAREENAYIVSLYWDSPIFRRGDGKAKSNNREFVAKAYKKETLELMRSKNLTDSQMKTAESLRKYIVTPKGAMMSEKHWKLVYETIIAGDPKGRVERALRVMIMSDYVKDTKKSK